MKKAFYRILLLVAVAGAGYGVYRFIQGLPSRQEAVPTTRVRQGDVVVRSFARGELRAVRSAVLTAPNLFGTVQVTKLAPMGAFAREKDLIVEFDDSEVLSRLEQRELELEQVDEQIKKAQADLAIRNNQDQVDLLRARYSVRRAELEVKKNPLLPAIDQKKNLLNLEEAQRRLRQLESDIKSKQEQALAELNVLRERRNRNLLDINREKQRLLQVKFLSPISGLVAIKQNRAGFSGMFGTQIPDIREGDQVQPGMPVAEILDLSELEVVARIGELDRANLHEGQDVLIRLDALAGKTFHGKIKSMSGTASANIFSSDPGKKFDVVFSIDMQQLLKELGARPEQIARILATAEQNRKKPIVQPTFSMFGGMPDLSALAAGGGAPGMGGGASVSLPFAGGQVPGMAGAAGGMQGMAGGAGGEGQAQRRAMMGGAGGGMMFGGANLSPEQQKKMQEIMKKVLGGKNMMELSPEERRAAFEKLREEAKKAGIEMPQRGQRREGGEGQPGGAGGAATAQAGAPGGDRGRRTGAGMAMPAPSGPFSQKDLENAKLPPPPEASDNTEILLRPGLLADVEIIVEKVTNAVYVPNQSIFEKDGKPVVYVKLKDRFEPRQIQIAKRSETVSIIASGIKPGEVIALQDPTISPEERKKKQEQKKGGGGGAAAVMPMGTKGGQ
ncbi:MAG: efflux RND transporter periplasmic adaptor subunit [Acidobacteriota bacterium]